LPDEDRDEAVNTIKQYLHNYEAAHSNEILGYNANNIEKEYENGKTEESDTVSV
jgi:hypothetical protein